MHVSPIEQSLLERVKKAQRALRIRSNKEAPDQAAGTREAATQELRIALTLFADLVLRDPFTSPAQ